MGLLRNTAKFAFATADLFLGTPSGPRILIYHRIGKSFGRQMEVTFQDFVSQIDWLRENRDVVDLDTAIARWEEPGSERLVVVTFDDGYRDNYTTAFPILRGRDIPINLYLTTGSLERDEYLTWDQVEEMVSTGLVTVGAHTHHHIDLRRASTAEIQMELERSNALIEERTGQRPRHFAYPWGYWSRSADTVVRKYYETAVLGAPPPSQAGNRAFDPYRIHRFPVQLSDARWFARRLDGGFLLEESIRRMLRGYRGP